MRKMRFTRKHVKTRINCVPGRPCWDYVGHCGPLLILCWASVGLSWASVGPLGVSGESLGSSGGPLGGLLGALWAFLGPRWASVGPAGGSRGALGVEKHVKTRVNYTQRPLKHVKTRINCIPGLLPACTRPQIHTKTHKMLLYFCT